MARMLRSFLWEVTLTLFPEGRSGVSGTSVGRRKRGPFRQIPTGFSPTPGPTFGFEKLVLFLIFPFIPELKRTFPSPTQLMVGGGFKPSRIHPPRHSGGGVCRPPDLLDPSVSVLFLCLVTSGKKKSHLLLLNISYFAGRQSQFLEELGSWREFFF